VVTFLFGRVSYPASYMSGLAPTAITELASIYGGG